MIFSSNVDGGAVLLGRLSKILRAEDFKRGTAIFPDINTDSIANRLKLRERGKERGAANQPEPSQSEFDSVELEAIAEVEELRRRGLQQFEDHLVVYRERLNRATEVRMEIEIAAGEAKGNFVAEVERWKAHFASRVDRLRSASLWREKFKAKNRLGRPAEEFSGWPKVIAIGSILLLIETALNGYLFAANNALGIAGGMIAAFLVSLANVGVSGILGYFAKFARHRNLIFKFFGLLLMPAWVLYASGFNLAVAHFRDAVEQSGDWTAAAEVGLATLKANALGITNIESWLLIVVGMLISFMAFMKGWTTDDPYPGYGKVHRMTESARADYAHFYSDAIDELERRRDTSIDDLSEAQDTVSDAIGEAIDALFGQSSLKAHLASFLQQCDVKTALLLSIYRDENRQARQAKAPKSFGKSYKFAPYEAPDEDTMQKELAQEEAKKIKNLVENSISEIFQAYKESVQTFREVDDVTDTDFGGRTTRSGHAAAPTLTVESAK